MIAFATPCIFQWCATLARVVQNMTPSYDNPQLLRDEVCILLVTWHHPPYVTIADHLRADLHPVIFNLKRSRGRAPLKVRGGSCIRHATLLKEARLLSRP